MMLLQHIHRLQLQECYFSIRELNEIYPILGIPDSTLTVCDLQHMFYSHALHPGWTAHFALLPMLCCGEVSEDASRPLQARTLLCVCGVEAQGGTKKQYEVITAIYGLL